MSGVFKPRTDILPPAQQRLWPELRPSVDHGFVLYGGTAIALRLGHRPSVDFDFFTEKPLDRQAIQAAFPFMAQATVLQDERNTLSVVIPYGDSEHTHIKISFFGTIDFGRVGQPDFTEDGVLLVASLDDLVATKVKVILQRAEAKDYRDIAVMIKAGVSLPKGLAAARELFGPQFQPSESMKALTYFGDGDLGTLNKNERSILVNAVSAVRELPHVMILSKELTSVTWQNCIEIKKRVDALSKLENTSGVAYTFWRLADEVIKATGSDKVNWSDIERKTIIECIGEHGQSPEDVADVLCSHSPGAVSPAQQVAIRSDIERLVPHLQAQYEQSQTRDEDRDHGIDPMG